MTCLEAQSNIMKFIDKKLPDDKITDFVRHIRHCPNCSEELEISFTLIVGMRQLDNNEEMHHNFKSAIDDELTRLENKIKNAKRFKISTFSIVFAAAVSFLLFIYDRGLVKVYNIEQTIKEVEQGETYFYDYFADELNICESDIIELNSKNNIVKKPTFYEKVRLYNYIHPPVKEDEDEDSLDNVDSNESILGE